MIVFFFNHTYTFVFWEVTLIVSIGCAYFHNKLLKFIKFNLLTLKPLINPITSNSSFFIDVQKTKLSSVKNLILSQNLKRFGEYILQ